MLSALTATDQSFDQWLSAGCLIDYCQADVASTHRHPRQDDMLIDQLLLHCQDSVRKSGMLESHRLGAMMKSGQISQFLIAYKI